MMQDDVNSKFWNKENYKQIYNTENISPPKEFFDLLRPNSSILDIGCGSGFLAENLSDKGYKVSGIDISSKAIEDNQNRHSKVDYKVADATEKIPFSNEFFDAAVIVYVLVNIPDRNKEESLITEMRRVLKPKGLVYICEALQSPDYEIRYKLNFPIVGSRNSFISFEDSDINSGIKTTKDISDAVSKGHAHRIVHHFQENELSELFSGFKVISKSVTEELVKRSNMHHFVISAVYQKL